MEKKILKHRYRERVGMRNENTAEVQHHPAKMSKESEEKTQNGKINFNVNVLSYQNANACHHHVIWLAFFSHCIVVISSSNVCIAQNILLIIIHAYIILLESMIKRPTATESASKNCALAWLLFSIVNIEFIVTLQWKCSKHYDVNHGKKKARDILWIQLRHTIESEENENEKELCTRWYFRCVLWRDTLIIIIYCMEQRSSGFLGANSIKKNEATSHAFLLIWFGCYEENCIVCFRFVCLFVVGIREPFHCPYGCWRFNSI